MGQSVFPIPSTLTTKGDLLAYDTAPNRLPVGADGTTLVANSASATGVAWAGPSVAAGKNFVINGGMDIWQRGTSIAVASNSATYVSDRFLGYCLGNTQTYSQSTSVPTTQFQYSLRIGGATSVTASQVRQRIEAANTLQIANATSATLSFWVYLSAAANANLYLNLDTPTSTVNDFSAVTSRVYQANIGTATNNAWTKITYTFNPSTFTNITYGLQTILDFASALANASYFALFTGFQLEIGSVATPFSRAGGTLQGELAACQRYYVRINPTGNYATLNTIGSATSTTVAQMQTFLPVPLRIPAISMDAGNIVASDLSTLTSGGTFILLTASGTNSAPTVRYTAGSAVFTQYRPMFIADAGASASYIGFNAEL